MCVCVCVCVCWQGATCYMNSFFQQLYMRESFRNELLQIHIPPPGEEVLKNPDPAAAPPIADTKADADDASPAASAANDDSKKKLVHKRDPKLETMFHELQLLFANLHSGACRRGVQNVCARL